MPEVFSKKYYSEGEATFGQKILRQGTIPFAALAVATPFVSNDLTVDYTGYARQAFKILPVHGAAGPTVSVEIQEFLPDPGKPNDGNDPTHGKWATKAGLGVGVAQMNELFEHNQEDTMRLTRIRLTPNVAVPTSGIKYELAGRRDT